MLSTKVEMNLPFQSLEDGFTANPDLTLFLASPMDPQTPEIPIIIKCTFSQDCASLWKTMKKEIDAHPEVVLLIVIIITEMPDYHSPGKDSDVWKQFVKKDRYCDAKSFLGLKDHNATSGVESLCQGCWSCVVQYHDCGVLLYVWVKDDASHRINVNSEHEALGVNHLIKCVTYRLDC